MSQSQYPNKFDTSAEIPQVRDNVTEIGSDVFNSLRSAIFQIEKTLGINPQGAIGNTVASRLNKVLDSDGNILSDAITKAGLISGPITNNEVAAYAGIDESKLDLNFPTKLLQNEISIINTELEQISTLLDEIAAEFSAHTNQYAKDRHKALSISVVGATTAPSDSASLDLEAGTLQDTLEIIYNAHINYSGANISELNNSHKSSQIYFDKSNVETFIKSNDLQGAVEDLAGLATTGLVDSILNLNSNGLIRQGSTYDDYEGSQLPAVLVEESTISYTQDNSSTTTINFINTPTPLGTISAYDTLRISGATDETDNKDYQILEYTLSSGNLTSVKIFGAPKSAANSNIKAFIFKNKYENYNLNGLNSVTRPRYNKSNTPDIQIANPNSAVIISSGIMPEKITSTAHTFKIKVDDNDDVNVNTYDSNVSKQTLDSIINKINEQAVENRWNFMAYKYRTNKCYELAISHNLPNFDGDIKNRTLKISTGASNDGTTVLGFGDVLGETYEGSAGNKFLLNGNLISNFGNIQTFTNSDIEIIASSQKISLTNNNLVELDIRIGDLFIIDGASNSDDNGTYRISTINDNVAIIDNTYSFADSLGDGVIYFLRVTAPIDELVFTEINSNDGTILFDVFITEDKDIFYSKRLEVDGEAQVGSFYAVISDVSKNFIVANETATLHILNTGYTYLTDPNGSDGDSVYTAQTGQYKIFSADKFSYITLDVFANAIPSITQTLTLYGFNEVAKTNFLISRGTYSTGLGRILGYDIEPGIPSVKDKRRTGTVDETIISESLLEKYIEGPRNDLRGSGVVRGCEVSNISLGSGYQNFDVSAGVAIVNGIRYEYAGSLSNRINSEDDFYIALDANGCLITGTAVDNPAGAILNGTTTISPFFDRTVAHLGFSESQSIRDLRLFINEIDYKFTNSIIVSNDISLGHFTSISDAVTYAKRFCELFPNSGTPEILIREGLYLVNSVITLDFDIKISGTGPTTVIQKTSTLATGVTPTSGNPAPLKSVFYIGNSTDNLTDEIIHGITIENLTYKTSSSIAHVGSFITLAESVGATGAQTKFFQFRNLKCLGPSTITYASGVVGNQIGEYALVIGFANTSTYTPASGTYGNIIISNCYFDRMGLEYGSCHFRDAASLTFQNVIAHGNISTRSSPNVGNTGFEIFEVVSNATLSKVIENGNSVS